MKIDPNKVIKTEPKMVKDGWGLVSSAVIGLVLLIGTIIFLSSCEKEYSSGTNYVYMFQAKISTDEWGIENWGGHQFTTDEKIKDIEAFKECYVNYLKWSGLDVDGLYNRLYYQDTKNISIKYDGTTYVRFTPKQNNICGGL